MSLMRYKLLALDLDGTLLGRDKTVADQDREAIARLSSQGVTVTIVTGRLYSGARWVADTIDVRGPIACINGGQMIDTRGNRELIHRRIGGSSATRLRDILGRRDLIRFGMFGDRIIGDRRGEPFTGFIRLWSDAIDHIADLLTHAMWRDEHGLTASIAVGAPDDIAATTRDIEDELPEAHVTWFDLPSYPGHAALVVRPGGTDKGMAIEWLADHHGIAVDEIVAVGDWLNDVPMLKIAGRSFATRQAPEAVKQAASDRLTCDPDPGGSVAEAIARAFWDE